MLTWQESAVALTWIQTSMLVKVPLAWSGDVVVLLKCSVLGISWWSRYTFTVEESVALFYPVAGLVDWAVKIRIRPPELDTSICDVMYHVSLSTGCVLGKWVCLVTLAMLFDLQDVCIAIGSLATLDLPMVVDLIGIYVLKGPYCTLNTTNWFLQALSVIPRGSWGDVARRFTMIRWASPKL
ncbi:sphingoid long-chain bases kinase 2, mitochondrial-like [Dorcoceras hygrometricum]|uniref:Sphingoid long-chain bases kinase 2, mitochondrial-like n=1 Tax=Dorcoceras hygrometricum TaxID=472368 RepID=A0A2Z7A5Z4_9LAMI|nr:sphingoid long-chain bases kinase 2, mitochondrial-like [Dorcoceras hygrometricum]